ncbi:hypothetical protein AUM84_07855 [Cronobacter sakazakii]|nr:hypothetical protein AUM84_07855 [Cronobacter sakazakii]
MRVAYPPYVKYRWVVAGALRLPALRNLAGAFRLPTLQNLAGALRLPALHRTTVFVFNVGRVSEAHPPRRQNAHKKTRPEARFSD